jgi:hypothetical protein
MRFHLTPVLGAVAALALAPAAALAALPTAHSTLIVPNKSLAGVKLGSSLAAASSAWGKGGTCGLASCSYTTTGDRNGTAAFLIAATTVGDPERVVSVAVEAGVLSASTGKHNFNTPLARYKTASGIGIGSTLAQLRHAYPHLVKEIGAPFYTLKGPGEGFTGFSVSEGRVQGVKMQSVHLG